MANYVAATRSNYFRVKDTAAFEAWCNKRDLDFWTKAVDEMGDCYPISADTGDCAGWPCYDSGTRDEFAITDELATQLDPRDVAILVEIGSEKQRYLAGYATAVHPDGRTVSVSLTDIHERATQAFGPTLGITEAAY
jgi:hypothetical protein